MNSKNEPARICEYSNTPVGAIKLLLQVGWRKFFRNPAPFQQLSLHDYQDGRAAFGIYRVMGDISNAERREIVSEAKSLMTSYKPYGSSRSHTLIHCSIVQQLTFSKTIRTPPHHCRHLLPQL